MLSILHNSSSLIAQNALNQTQGSLNTSLQRLSTGLKINSGADNPAGLVISEEQRAQINGLQSAITNTSKAVNVVQTAEGALNEVSTLLDQIRGLAVDSANLGVNDSAALAANQAQINNALATINSIANQTQFGQKKLLDGTAGQQFTTLSGGSNVTSATGGVNTAAGTYTLNITQQGIKGQGTAAAAFTGLTQAVTGASADAGGTIKNGLPGGVTLAPSTQAGNYTITYNQQGIRANVAGLKWANTGLSTTALTANETLTITGAFNATVNLVAGQTLTQAIASINGQLQAQGITGFTAQQTGTDGATTSALQFVSTAYGANPAINVTSTTTLATGSGYTTTTTNGQAGQALIFNVNGGPNINGSGASGNQVNISSGQGAGISYTLAEQASGGPAGTLSLKTVAGGGGATNSATLQISGTESLTLNGTVIQLNAQNAGNSTQALATINSYSSQTGVTASLGAGNKLVFTANAFGGNVSAVESGDFGTAAYTITWA